MRGRDDPRGAALLLLGSSALFSCAGALIKVAAASLPNEMIVFARAFIGFLLFLPWLARQGRDGIRTRYLRQQVTRALAGLAAMYCFFYAVGHLPLAEAMLLNYSSPLFIPFIARLWIGEPIPPRIGWVIGIGFAGITMILKPGIGFFSPAAVVGVCSSVLTAVAMVSIRGLARFEPPGRIVFYFCTVCSIAGAVPLLWTWRAPSAPAIAALLGLGVLATIGQVLLTRAYGLAPAAKVGPFTYATVVFSALLGWVFWDEVPDALSFAGAVLVCAAGVMATRSMAPQIDATPEEAIPDPSV